MNRKTTFKARLQYQFDNLMSKGTLVLVLALFILSLTIIILAALMISVLSLHQDDGSAITFGEALWEALMRTLDSGTMGGDTGTGFRLVMFFVTLGGVFIVSTLIGVLSNGLEDILAKLRKGRSHVIESNHTVILGWSQQVFTLISELVIANENNKNQVIAILADKDKVEMEDALRERVPQLKTTRVICRSGNPVDPTDLDIVNPHEARAIIILPPDEGDADSQVIKAALALTNSPQRHAEPYNIVTQINDAKNMDVIKLIGVRDNLHAILTSEVVAHVTAQTSRQSGLSVAYIELLNFEGDEIYFKEEPGLVKKTYGDALLAYEDSSVIGLRFADGRVQLNPDQATRIAAGDKIIAVSADDDTVNLSKLNSYPINAAAIHPAGHGSTPAPERCLILGWNETGTTIVHDLDNYVAAGSAVTIITRHDNDLIRAQCQDSRQTIEVQNGDTTDRALLNSLALEKYNHVIVLADPVLEPHEADARTLVTLLHLRDIAVKNATHYSIVSEMLDLRNRELAEVTQVDDFIVSEHFISLMLAQLAENAELQAVFADLFDPEGAEIYLKPITDYVNIEKEVTFYTLVEAARQRGESALGYRLQAQAGDAAQSYGVKVNPRKTVAVQFHANDKLIVLAEQ